MGKLIQRLQEQMNVYYLLIDIVHKFNVAYHHTGSMFKYVLKSMKLIELSVDVPECLK